MARRRDLKIKLPRGLRADRLKLLAAAAATLARAQLRHEWAGSALHRWLIARPAPQGRAATPVDLRPARPKRGKAMVGGRFVFDGLAMDIGPGGDPWNRAAPSRAFAETLHGMGWLPDLLAAEGGARTALSLVLGWQAVFGRWNGFAWSAPVLERRVFNLACALEPLIAEAGETEAHALLTALARQARHLLLGDGACDRAAERAAAAAVAACVLAGPPGDKLLARALKALDRTLPQTVLPDGGHASRSPEAGLELLLDLRTLDATLTERGQPAPAALTRAIDRLGGMMHLLILADGRLPALQGSEAGDRARIAAAMIGGMAPAQPPRSAPDTGFERLDGKVLQVIVDVGAPARGPWSAMACAHPLAIEVLAANERLIGSTAWSPRADGAQALRLTPAASTACVSDASCGAPLTGRLARILGHRLAGAPRAVTVRRHDSEAASWLELSHQGWAEAFGLAHDRRLYLDRAAGELRGEDLLRPVGETPPERGKRPAFLTVRFQLHPEVKASLALDHKSVLLQPKGGGGWWLRNDAPEVLLEPAVHLEDGRPQATHQVVMRALLKRDGTARIRWKLGAGN